MLNVEHNFYQNRLRLELDRRQRNNSGYSLRAFSRDLNMHPSTLTQVLKGKRPLPQKNKNFVINTLAMTPTEEAIFRQSLTKKTNVIDSIDIDDKYSKRLILDDSQYKVLAEWEHYAILTLIETENFKSDIDFIANRFNLKKKIVLQSLDTLETVGLIKRINGEIKLAHDTPVATTEDISSKALKASHKETLEMGKNKLDEIEVELRDFSSMTIAVNLEDLPEAKTIIREFRKKMATFLRDGDKPKEEVFQLAVQFYPLTQINNLENDNEIN